MKAEAAPLAGRAEPRAEGAGALGFGKRKGFAPGLRDALERGGGYGVFTFFALG